MLDRASFLNLIDTAYENRAAGDKAAVNKVWAKDGVYHFAGDASLLPRLPVGPGDGVGAIDTFIDLITFLKQERLDAVVEERKAVVHWRVTMSINDGAPVTTDLCDIWTIDDTGQCLSLTQFGDTALLAQQLH